MKKLLLIAGLLTATLFAADFSKATIEELNDMRDKVVNEDKADYIEEVRKRMKEMTPDEIAKYEITQAIAEMEQETKQPAQAE